MKLFTSCFFLVLIWSNSLCAQTKSNLDYYFKLDNAKTDKEKLDINLEMSKAGFAYNYTYISNYFYNLKNNRLGFKYLKKAVKKGALIDDGYVNSFVPEKDLKKIKKKYQQLRTSFYKTFDEKTYNEVNYMFSTDQYLAKEKFYGGRKEQHPIRKKVFQNNLTKLRNYIISYNKKQLPQYNQIGNLTNDVTIMLMHHTRLDSIDEVNYNFFEALIKEEVLIRKSYSPYTYIQFVDNMQLVMEEGKPQVYGHYRNFKTNKICPLKYPEKVDSLRAAIGLQPLKEYARKKGFLLPDNYIEK